MCGARSLASGVAAFFRTYKFNGDLSKWVTSKVRTLQDSTCSSLHSLASFSSTSTTRSVRDFYILSKFHRSVTSLTESSSLLSFFVWSFVFARNARSLTSGVAVFNEAFVFNGDLSKWDTSKVYHIGQSTCFLFILLFIRSRS